MALRNRSEKVEMLQQIPIFSPSDEEAAAGGGAAR